MHGSSVVSALASDAKYEHGCWNFGFQTCSINVIYKNKKYVDIWLQIGTGGPFLLCVCECVLGWGLPLLG